MLDCLEVLVTGSGSLAATCVEALEARCGWI